MEENKQVLDEALQLVDEATDEELDDMPDFFKEREKRNRIARFERNGINLNDTKEPVESVKEVVKGDTPVETLSEVVKSKDKPLHSRALPEPDEFLAKKEEEIKAMAEESKEKLNKLTEETIDKLKGIHKETSETIKDTLKAMEESINKVSKKATEVKAELDNKTSEVKDKVAKVAKDVKESVVGEDGKFDKEDVDRLSKEAITALASIAGNAEKLFGMLRRELEKMEKGQDGKTGD